MIKEVKYGGITTTPSDYESKDGDLASSSGIVLDEGRVLVTRTPSNALGEDTFTYKPVFKHVTTDGTEHWISESQSIFYDESSETQEIVDLTGSEFVKIEAIGNTLIIIMDDSINYVVCKDGKYVSLGNHIPEMNIRFGLEGRLNRSNPKTLQLVAPLDYDGQTRVYSISDDNIDAITKQIFGEVEIFMDEAGAESGMFAYPFFVRYAIRLYDGSYTNISAPILMETNIGNAPVVGYHDNGQTNTNLSYFSIYNVFCKLKAEILGSLYVYDGWDDVVKGVDIFVSSQFQGYDPLGRLSNTIIDATSVVQSTKQPLIDAKASCLWVGERTGAGITDHQYELLGYNEVIEDYFDFDGWDPDFFFSLPYTNPANHGSRHRGGSAEYYDPSKKQNEAIESNSTFYKLYSYDFKNVTVSNVVHYVVNGLSNTSSEVPSGENILANIETQKALPDDYFSHDHLITTSAFVYNSRLSLGGITREIFSGFPPTSLNPLYSGTSASEASVSYHVLINENGTRMQADSVKQTIYIQSVSTKWYGIIPPYFYYPNPNAFKLVVEITMNDETKYAEYDMKPHPTLNGAYCLNRNTQNYPAIDDSNVADYSRNNQVSFPSQIYTSEAYNPYVFKAENINQLPIAANILNIASTTQPMSQGQFGQYPLYVFSDMGIFALELASNGNFSGLTPVTRDIILGDGSSLTQLDDSLLFATKQGIMELVGKNTRCISTELDVEAALPTLDGITNITTNNPDAIDFKTFISGCKMVYDYVNARIVVFNPTMGYSYVYSAKDKAWSIIDRYDLIDTINAYPEAQAVAETTTTTGGTTTTTYSIIDLSTITDEQTAQAGQPTPTNEGWFITRPISLDADNNFKFIDTIRQNGVFEEYMVKENGEYKGYNAVASRNNPKIGDPVYAETGAHEVVRQVLYGSNDLINWFVCGSSRSRYITELKGAQFKWYRLAVRTKFKYGESLSSVTFSYRIKAENPHLF